ncbi:hypothetical protein QQ045_015886 [Rhodiola kirilowii]
MWNAMSENMRFSAEQKWNIIQRDYGYQISYWKAWKAQQKALVNLFSKWDESFNRLPHLMQALQDSSHNNFVKWDVTPLDDGTMQMTSTDIRASVSLTGDPATTFLPKSDVNAENSKWWKRNLGEARIQILFALPMIVTNVCY